jgi:hypothetical protein
LRLRANGMPPLQPYGFRPTTFLRTPNQLLWPRARRGDSGVPQVERMDQKEEPEIFCGDLFTLLPVTNVPPKRCSERGFSGAGWDVQGGGQTDVDSYGLANIKALFYARCVRPNHPMWGHRDWDKVDASLVGGFQRIQSYMPGQVCLLWLCLNDGLTTPHPEATITREAN